MSTVNTMISCPRIAFEDGKPVECDCEVEIELEIDGCYMPATWGYWGGSPAEYPSVSLLNYPTTCPETDQPYTMVELKELERRGERAADKYEPEEADRA
jgi:hypothetical protein